jgi:molecular chaperone DnaK
LNAGVFKGFWGSGSSMSDYIKMIEFSKDFFMPLSIGIDLGENYGRMWYATPFSHPLPIFNKENASLTPSVVALKKGEKTGESILVGQLAEDYSSAAGKDYLYSVKRLIGRGYEDKDVQKMLGKVSYDILPSPHGKEDVVRVKLGDKLYEPKEISAITSVRLLNINIVTSI